MGQVGSYLWRSHLSGVALLVEPDKVSDVVQVGFLGFSTEVPKARNLAHAVEEFGLLRCFHRFGCGKSPQMGVLSRNCGITTHNTGVRPQVLDNTLLRGVILYLRSNI